MARAAVDPYRSVSLMLQTQPACDTRSFMNEPVAYAAHTGLSLTGTSTSTNVQCLLTPGFLLRFLKDLGSFTDFSSEVFNGVFSGADVKAA